MRGWCVGVSGAAGIADPIDRTGCLPANSRPSSPLLGTKTFVDPGSIVHAIVTEERYRALKMCAQMLVKTIFNINPVRQDISALLSPYGFCRPSSPTNLAYEYLSTTCLPIPLATQLTE